jgi:hypothetical protein
MWTIIKNNLMKKRLLPLALPILLFLLSAPFCMAGYYDAVDPTMGSYDGFWTAKNGAKGRVIAQIRPLGNNQYDGFLLLMRSKSPVAAFTFQPGQLANSVLKLKGAFINNHGQGDLLGKNETECELHSGKITGKFSGDLGEGTFEASKTSPKSPTLGLKAPRHATVMFDGSNLGQWQESNWKITPEGLEVGKGDLRAKAKLPNFRMHLEFRTPYMPEARGQSRGNSGVYLQSKYEIQVLDSFGLYPLQDNDCGGLYKVQAPRLNACHPPMSWQTYDITFVAGTDSKPATVTVDLNGARILDHVHIPESVAKSGTGSGDQDGGFLKLQDHGNPVQYRNIWVEPIFSVEKKR